MARVHKCIINHDAQGDRHIKCAWDECERDGYELHKVRVNYGSNDYPQVTNYVFCTERHRQYWIYGHRRYGNLPPGYRLSTI